MTRGSLIRAGVLVIGSCLPLCVAAEVRTLYRSVLPDGRVVFGDEPAPSAQRSRKITVEPHPPNPQQAEAALRALSLTRAQLLRDAAARDARLKQIDNDIADAYLALKDAEARRSRGQEVQEGDKQGRRLTSSFVERQRVLRISEQQARQRLDRLLSERGVLQN